MPHVQLRPHEMAVIVLAGAKLDPPRNCDCVNHTRRADVPVVVNGQKDSLINPVLRAVHKAGFPKIHLVAEHGALYKSGNLGVEYSLPVSDVVQIDPGITVAESLWRACKATDDYEYRLILDGFCPFVTEGTILSYLYACEQRQELTKPACFALSHCNASTFTKAFPSAKKTFVKIGKERYTLGGAYLAKGTAQSLEPVFYAARTLYQMRKHPLAMAQWAGWSILGKFLFNMCGIPTLEIAKLEQYATHKLKIPMLIVPAPSELGLDIDEKDIPFPLDGPINLDHLALG